MIPFGDTESNLFFVCTGILIYRVLFRCIVLFSLLPYQDIPKPHREETKIINFTSTSQIITHRTNKQSYGGRSNPVRKKKRLGAEQPHRLIGPYNVE
jgi:hypothetical protein